MAAQGRFQSFGDAVANGSGGWEADVPVAGSGPWGAVRRDMARYGQQFIERRAAGLLPPESSPVEVASQTVGISVATLERWRAEVLARPSGEEARHWTPAARSEAVIASPHPILTCRVICPLLSQ